MSMEPGSDKYEDGMNLANEERVKEHARVEKMVKKLNVNRKK